MEKKEKSQIEEMVEAGIASHLRITKRGDDTVIELFATVKASDGHGSAKKLRETGFCIYQGADEKLIAQNKQIAELFINQVVTQTIMDTIQRLDEINSNQPTILDGNGVPIRVQPGIVKLPPGFSAGNPRKPKL